MQPGSHVGGQRLGHWRRQLRGQRSLQLGNGVRHQPRLLHLVCGDIVWLHAHLRELHVVSLVHIGMTELIASAIRCRLAEDDIPLAHLIIIIYVFGAIEPDNVANASAIGDMSNYAHLARLHGELLETEYAPHHLHERHVAPQVADIVYLAPVHIFIWIVFEQVTPCADAELLAQYLLSPWPYALQKHYVLFENV